MRNLNWFHMNCNHNTEIYQSNVSVIYLKPSMFDKYTTKIDIVPQSDALVDIVRKVIRSLNSKGITEPIF